MIVIDTTILVYAVGREHQLKKPSARVMEAVATGAVKATTTVEVIQEFAHIRSRRLSRSDAVAAARHYAALLDPLLTTGVAALRHGLTLFERHARVGAFDAVLAAVAIDADATALVSADGAFADIPGLRYVAPGTPAFDRLLVP